MQSSCLEFNDEGFTLDYIIYYNDTQTEKRIRFTLMYEIGHMSLLVYAIDKSGSVSEDDIRHIFNVSHPVAEYAYDYYNKWINHIKINFGLPEIDITIYNLFYRSAAI